MMDRSPLLRMMFLITFIIVFLVISSTYFASKKNYNPIDPVFNENIILQNNKKAYSVLLHSISFHDHFVSAYAVKLDSFLTFPKTNVDSRFINNKLGSFSNKLQNCTNCHNDNWE